MASSTWLGGTVLSVCLLALACPKAEALLFSADNGGTLAAAVTFEASGTELVVTLTNTSPADVVNPAQVLTGVFFTLAGDPTLIPVSAMLNDGSTVLCPTGRE
jgi:hypothetical protein